MAKRRRHFGRGAQRAGDTGIVIEDEATPFLLMAEKNFRHIYRRAIRHIGFEIHDRAKRYVRNDEHKKSLSVIQEERVIDRAQSKGQRLRRKRHAGDLNRSGKSIINAIKYERPKNINNPVAIVGFASNDARRVSGYWFQAGRNKTVTASMKQHFFALADNARGRQKARLLAMANIPVGTIIRVPARPIFDPVNRIMGPKIPRLLQSRIDRNLGLIEDNAYQAILYSEIGINDNIREAEKQAKIAEGVARRDAKLSGGRNRGRARRRRARRRG